MRIITEKCHFKVFSFHPIFIYSTGVSHLRWTIFFLSLSFLEFCSKERERDVNKSRGTLSHSDGIWRFVPQARERWDSFHSRLLRSFCQVGKAKKKKLFDSEKKNFLWALRNGPAVRNDGRGSTVNAMGSSIIKLRERERGKEREGDNKNKNVISLAEPFPRTDSRTRDYRWIAHTHTGP